MNITNENQLIEKPINKKFIPALIIIFIVVIIIVLLSFKGSRTMIFNFFSNKDAVLIAKATDIDYSIKGSCRTAVFGEDIIVCDENGITALDKYGKWQWNEKTNFITPVISVKGEYMLITDIGGTSVHLYKNLKLLYKENFPLGIISSNLGKNGCVMVIQKEESYQVSVSMIKPEGDPKIAFTRKFGDTFVMASAMSDDGDQIITSAMNMAENEGNSSISFLRTSDGEVFSTEIIQKELFPLVWYMPDNTVFLSSGESIRRIKKTSSSSDTFDINETIWAKGSSNLVISCGSKVMNKYLVIAFYPDTSSPLVIGGRSTIKIFDNDGKEKSSFIFEGEATGISSSKDTVAVYSDNRVTLYNISGKIQGEYTNGSNIKDVSFISNKEILISSKDKIVYVEFLHKIS